MNCWRSQLCWSPIFCKTYKLQCNMWCVMGEMWCVMFQTWFFVRSWLYESKGNQKHTISVFSYLFNDIPKFIPGGSRMYTIYCKASYDHIFINQTSKYNFCKENSASFSKIILYGNILAFWSFSLFIIFWVQLKYGNIDIPTL